MTSAKIILQTARRRIKDETMEDDAEEEIQLEEVKPDKVILDTYSDVQMIQVLRGMSIDGSEDSKSFSDDKDDMKPVKVQKCKSDGMFKGHSQIKFFTVFKDEYSTDVDSQDDKSKVPKLEDPLPFFNMQTSVVDQQPLMLFQFPDTLPVKIKDEVQDIDEDSEEESNLKTAPKSKGSTLLDLKDGCIGKIVVYKSGKTKFVLGDSIAYNIDKGFGGGL